MKIFVIIWHSILIILFLQALGTVESLLQAITFMYLGGTILSLIFTTQLRRIKNVVSTEDSESTREERQERPIYPQTESQQEDNQDSQEVVRLEAVREVT